jgi:hypothetical protein
MPFSSSRPSIKGKALLRFPARVDEGAGIAITKAAGVYTFALDYATLADNAGIADPSLYSVAVWNTVSEEFEEVRLDGLNTSTTGDTRTPRGDADYTILNTDAFVPLTAALTAARTWTLPAASAVDGGKRIVIHDEGGGITATNTLTIDTAGADTINGGASFVLNVARAGIEIRSNGTDAWTVGLIGTTSLADLSVTTAKLSTTALDGLTTVVAATGDLMAIVDVSDSNKNKKALAPILPASVTDNAAARFNGTTGKDIQEAALIIADTTGGLSRSGNGGIPLQGTNTNDDAAAGDVGEYISALLSAGSAVSLSTGTTANVTSISLTAGDWDVHGNVGFTPNAATTMATLQADIGTTSATFDTAPAAGSRVQFQLTFATGASQIIAAGRKRLSLSSTTTVYLLTQATFAVNTLTAYGFIGARRVR